MNLKPNQISGDDLRATPLTNALVAKLDAEHRTNLVFVIRQLVNHAKEMERAVARSESTESTEPKGPLDNTVKRPRLFYWEDAEDCWCPAAGLMVDNIIDADSFLHDGDIQEIRFKREDMTDADFDAIPEG